MKKSLFAAAVLLAIVAVGAECNPPTVTPNPQVSDGGNPPALDGAPLPARDSRPACVGICACACEVMGDVGCPEGADQSRCRRSCEADLAFWAKTPTPEKALPAACVAGAASLSAVKGCGVACKGGK